MSIQGKKRDVLSRMRNALERTGIGIGFWKETGAEEKRNCKGTLKWRKKGRDTEACMLVVEKACLVVLNPVPVIGFSLLICKAGLIPCRIVTKRK